MWLSSPRQAARVCPSSLQLNIKEPTSLARSSSKGTWAQRRQQLWMWAVSRNYFISERLILQMETLCFNHIIWPFNVCLCIVDVKEVRLTQILCVSESETLTLKCSVEGFLQTVIKWIEVFDQSIKNGTGTTLRKTTFNDLLYSKEERGTATLSIFNVTAELRPLVAKLCPPTFLSTINRMGWTDEEEFRSFRRGTPFTTDCLIFCSAELLHLQETYVTQTRGKKNNKILMSLL